MNHANKKAWHACSLIIKQSQQSFGLLLSGCYHINGFNVCRAKVQICNKHTYDNTYNDMLHDIMAFVNAKM